MMKTACLLAVALFPLALVAAPAGQNGATERMPSPASSQASVGDYCFSSSCNRSAAFMEKAINPLADPCDNFYEFACGGYVRNTVLPPHEAEVSTISQMQDNLLRQLRDLLSEPIATDNKEAFKIARTLYQSCVNTTLLEELGLDPARNVLKAVGGWPLLEGDSWDEHNFELNAMLLKLEDLGLSAASLFSLDIASIGNGYSVQVTLPKLNIDLTGYDSKTAAKRFDEYVNLITNVTTLFAPADANLTKIQMEISRIASFERDLNSHMPSLEDRWATGRLAAMRTLDSLNTKHPYVDWSRLISHLVPASYNVTDELLVSVKPMTYFEGLGKELSGVDKRTLVNYLVWRALHQHLLPNLNTAMRTMVTEHSTRRVAEGVERWKECTKFVHERAPVLTSALFARRFTSADMLAKARSLAEEVSTEIVNLVKAADWMQPEDKLHAEAHANVKVKFMVGYPDIVFNDTYVEGYVQEKQNPMLVDTFLKNVLELSRILRRNTFRRLVVGFTSEDVIVNSGKIIDVNAFNFDSILGLTLGILQDPAFNANRPRYLNYGVIGFAIGHEYSHSFDLNGMIFENTTLAQFQKKSQCIIEQYSNITDKATNLTVNGVLTQAENIADQAGAKVARIAYEKHVAKFGPEPSIPLQFPAGSRLDLSPQQMLWVSLAQFFCAKQSLQELEKNMHVEQHVPHGHRVNGLLKNEKAFAADYKCAAGAPMNPVHKCHIW
ncbi:hypothetical protein ONE63_010355 [Megalurothrips usitatus]|uniref:Uncharacterized protein n=1 Tax=Megalurothrips usitatus TaxID=439358 RepID=A0AAV7XLS9_9NEOP|nr:hypothetical protein ONE63_010355 [Megalurothrips usitatus]